MNFDYGNPDDRRMLIASGMLWELGDTAVQLGVADIAEGRVPAPAALPPEVMRLVDEYGAKPTPPALPEPPDAAPTD
jgi:hypothetical protein